jgi:hypothetical protein
MHVIVHQRITDPDRFRVLTEEPTPDRPAHWRLITCAPTRDGSACFSLWWADSAEALRHCLLRAIGAAGPLECHEVDDDNAMGLAERAVTLVHVALRERLRGDDFLPAPPEGPYLPGKLRAEPNS